MSRYKSTLSLKIARRIGSLRDEMLTLNMQCQLSLESRIEECRRELEHLVKMHPK